MDALSDELNELFADLLAASDPVVGLDAAQRDVWASGLLSTWRSAGDADDPSAIDRLFRDYCAAASSEVGDLVAAAINSITEPQETPTDGPAAESADFEATGAWRVTRGYQDESDGLTGSFIVGFVGDEIEHSMLAEVVDGALVDLVFGPSPAELVPDADVVWEEMGQRITVAELTVDAASEAIVAAWQITASVPVDDPADGLLMNQMVSLARLRSALGDPALRLAPITEQAAATLSFTEGMTDDEVDEADRWAVGVLTSALRRLSRPEPPSADMIATTRVPIRGPIDSLDIADQRALVFLEWADWLGVIIGLTRAGPGATVTASALVDLINTCPEVSTTVPAADREFVEHALGVAIELWTAGGVVKGGVLGAEGHAALLPAARGAWGAPD